MASKDNRQTIAVEAVPTVQLGPVSLAWPKYDSVKDSRFGKPGEKSTPTADYTVEIAPGVNVHGTIYGNAIPLSDGMQITFAASAPSARVLSFASKDTKDNFIAHVEQAAVKWSAFDAATEAAANRLMGIKTAAAAGKLERPDMRPRLVKVAQTSATAVQTVQ